MSLVVPAVLPTSHTDLEEKLSFFSTLPSVSRVQIDVVDGHFAAPASWPYTAPFELRARVDRTQMLPHLDRIEYEIDLMCLDAVRAARTWIELGASRLTFHATSAIDFGRLLQTARTQFGPGVVGERLASFGLAVAAGSDLAVVEPYLGQVSYVQFMGIEHIGRQGQLFDPRVLHALRTFRVKYPSMPVQVDGGVTLETAKELLALGVANLVVGSLILKAQDPARVITAIEEMQSPYGV